MSGNNQSSTQGVKSKDAVSLKSLNNNDTTTTTSIPMCDSSTVPLLSSTTSKNSTANTSNDASNSNTVGGTTSSGTEVVEGTSANNNNNPTVAKTGTTATDTAVDKGNQGKKWTSEEDSIVIREFGIDSSKFYVNAVQYLNGRSQRAIKDRWSKYLAKDHDPSYEANAANKTRWTEEEDSLIITHWKTDPINFADECEKLLEGRSKVSIKNRWNKHLKKNHGASTQTSDNSGDTAYPKAHNRFTSEEDEIIIA